MLNYTVKCTGGKLTGMAHVVAAFADFDSAYAWAMTHFKDCGGVVQVWSVLDCDMICEFRNS